MKGICVNSGMPIEECTCGFCYPEELDNRDDKREVRLIARFGVRLDNKEDYGKPLRLEYEFNQN